MAASASSSHSPEGGVGGVGAGAQSSGWRPDGSAGLVDRPEHWLRWKFGQCFGDRDATESFSEADVLSAVEFDPTGEYLATGDKGGRVVVFKRAACDEDETADRETEEAGGMTRPRPCSSFRFYMEFQSHEAEFDYLKSMDIEEKINEIAWCPQTAGALFMLTTNDKTVKLWKVHEKTVMSADGFNVTGGSHGGRSVSSGLRVPRLQAAEDTVCATAKRVFANAHAYHINSVSVNSDGQTFLSSDDLRINLWSLDNAKLSFTMVDIKPEHMEELSEVITASCFHPTHCNVFSYSTSRGAVKLGDMRASALCDTHAKLFEDTTEEASAKSYFSEITASVSGVAFLPGERMATRDYLSVKVWDLRTERRPLLVVPVHEHLRPRLCDLYENDSIFDKFEIAASADGRGLITGTYNDTVKLFDTVHGEETHVSLARMTPSDPAVHKSLDPSDADAMSAAASSAPSATLDFARKVLHYAWHPQSDTVAIAGLNNLHIYNAVRLDGDPGDATA